MNPRYIEELSWRMGEVYAAVVDQILINLARHFKRIVAGQEPTGAWAYQVQKLAEMGQVNRETERIILSMLGNADEALRTVLEESILNGLKDAEPALRRAAFQGLLPDGVNVPPVLNPAEMQAFRAYYKQSANHLNLVNTVMLESTQAAYQATVADVVTKINNTQGILNVATGEVVTGVTSWNQAVTDAVKKMVDNGITGFIDHGGHKWSPEAYVTMDVRTTMANTARAAVFERMDDYGSDLYQVSWHNGARPLCFPWQAKVISRTDTVRDIKDGEGNPVHVYAQSETTYGQAAGLFGVNCGHYPIPFFPGMSRIRQPQEDAEENAREYEESQKQRYLERRFREEKRDLEVLKAQGASEEELKTQRAKVKKCRDNLNEFCDETGRARRSSRERTPINATFPDDKTYNPVTFPTDERDKMQDFFNGYDNEPMSVRKPTEWPKGDGGISAEQLQALSDHASQNGIRLDANSFKRFEGSAETVQEVIDSVATVAKDFPAITAGKKPLLLSNSYSMADGDFAVTTNKTITLNNNAFRNRKALEAEYSRLVKSGVFPTGTTYKSIGFHEAGHVVRNVYRLPIKEIIKDINAANISLYAASRNPEMIAEAFNSYYSGNIKKEVLTILERCRIMAIGRGEQT